MRIALIVLSVLALSACGGDDEQEAFEAGRERAEEMLDSTTTLTEEEGLLVLAALASEEIRSGEPNVCLSPNRQRSAVGTYIYYNDSGSDASTLVAAYRDSAGSTEDLAALKDALEDALAADCGNP